MKELQVYEGLEAADFTVGKPCQNSAGRSCWNITMRSCGHVITVPHSDVSIAHVICPECLKPALQKSKGIFTDASWAHWWRYHRKDVREIPSKLAMPVDPDEPRMQQAEQGGEIE